MNFKILLHFIREIKLEQAYTMTDSPKSIQLIMLENYERFVSYTQSKFNPVAPHVADLEPSIDTHCMEIKHSMTF